MSRDHAYVRHGTVSIIAAVDLHDGHLIAQVCDRHRSREFIGLLKALDAHYPTAAVIRVILDNHSAHISKETRAYLANAVKLSDLWYNDARNILILQEKS